MNKGKCVVGIVCNFRESHFELGHSITIGDEEFKLLPAVLDPSRFRIRNAGVGHSFSAKIKQYGNNARRLLFNEDRNLQRAIFLSMQNSKHQRAAARISRTSAEKDPRPAAVTVRGEADSLFEKSLSKLLVQY